MKNGSGMGGLHLAAQSGSVAMMAYLLVRYKTIEKSGRTTNRKDKTNNNTMPAQTKNKTALEEP